MPSLSTALGAVCSAVMLFVGVHWLTTFIAHLN